ncbi:hypothetical protein [Mesorhizobium sp. B2-1-2]|uniref:hypothetical protein n=1 Tax=Mesorhizobium sp. B2-1-2 TaxID=2589973 RepID=UPI00112ED27F|nr:hypothetical protein [Mesorhizobium sp. B2-1-2]TPN04537.1 hypothetical protein FJ971_29795 [Mesorhizobium sp. B2-1-2]
MAKIANLDVGTIKIGNAALTGTVQASYAIGTNASITIPDNYGNPVLLYWSNQATVTAGGSSNQDGGGSLGITITKTGVGTFYTDSLSVGKQSSATPTWGGSVLDPSPAATQNYSAVATGSTFGPNGSVSNSGVLMAMYVKK